MPPWSTIANSKNVAADWPEVPMLDRKLDIAVCRLLHLGAGLKRGAVLKRGAGLKRGTELKCFAGLKRGARRLGWNVVLPMVCKLLYTRWCNIYTNL